MVGVYSGFCNHYNIGAFMEKGLTMAAGQVYVLSMSTRCLAYVVRSARIVAGRHEYYCSSCL